MKSETPVADRGLAEVGGDTKNASNMFKPASLVKTFITEEEQKEPRRYRRAAKKAQDIYSQPLNQIEAELFSAPPLIISRRLSEGSFATGVKSKPKDMRRPSGRKAFTARLQIAQNTPI
jgi:hypothetical protein